MEGAASVRRGLVFVLGNQHPGDDWRQRLHPGDTQCAWQEGQKQVIPAWKEQAGDEEVADLAQGLLRSCEVRFCITFPFLTSGPALPVLCSDPLIPVPWAPPLTCLQSMKTELETSHPPNHGSSPWGDHNPVLSRQQAGWSRGLLPHGPVPFSPSLEGN